MAQNQGADHPDEEKSATGMQEDARRRIILLLSPVFNSRDLGGDCRIDARHRPEAAPASLEELF
jgi:hypothetical protein